MYCHILRDRHNVDKHTAFLQFHVYSKNFNKVNLCKLCEINISLLTSGPNVGKHSFAYIQDRYLL